MKKFVLVFSIMLCVSFNTYAQNYKTHKVQQGETIAEIAKIYKVTPFDIYALNPDTKTKLEPNVVLIIPKTKILENPVTVEEIQLLGYKSHRVKRKETLYSIAKNYNITVEDIKKHNARLYSENLRKGDKIKIPNYSTVQVTTNLGNTIRKYQVLPKEGKWRVAFKFGISVSELEELNPQLGDSLKIGEEINVPNIANNEEKEVDETFGYYTVLPKEGFYRLKVKLGMEQEEIENLNPGVSVTGLKEGMILKVPKSVDAISSPDAIEFVALRSRMTNFSKKRLAVMLPFRLQRIDLDSIAETKVQIEKDPYLSISLDFHTGVLMAVDSAKQLGISTGLDVYDTKSRTAEVSKLISDNNFENYDAVIGPLTADNFDRVAVSLKAANVPVISPLTKPNTLHDNVFQTIPSDDLLLKTMVSFVKQDSIPNHVIIIADSKHQVTSNLLKKEFPTAKQLYSRKNKEEEEAYYILTDDVKDQLKEGKNIIFLETENEGFASNVTSMINAFIDEAHEIILMTTNKSRAFDGANVSNYDLSNLRFHYPSPNRPYDIDATNTFIKRYKREYGTVPNRFAVRGFDLTMDILLRLAFKENLYQAATNTIETEYVENKFRYSKKMFGGYYNEAVYVVKYDSLKIVEAKN
ncbi:MAG: LysM peptidoglycan-binding domain-containing protein [Flavobacteriaceae bacterium]|nr:LysM peptidoglycan-binding domain-containing protein [Flavobacteriaceae bacterium]